MSIRLDNSSIYTTSDYTVLEEYRQIEKFCAENTPESVESFKKYCELKKGEFKNGGQSDNNILMKAAGKANVLLVKYIAENSNQEILDLYDKNGRTALHHAVRSDGPAKDVIACAKILLEAKANPSEAGNVAQGKEDPLGFVLRMYVGFNNAGALSAENKKKYQTLIDLFVSHGVKGAMSGAYIKGEGQVGWCGISDAYPEGYRTLKHEYLWELKEAKTRCDQEKCWSKARLIPLSARDPNSRFNGVPSEVQKLIYETIWDLRNEEEKSNAEKKS